MKLLNSKWIRTDTGFKLLWLASKGGKKVIVDQDPPFLPYFFVKKDDLNKIPKEWLYDCYVETDPEAITFDDQYVVKIECNVPADVGRIRDKIESRGIQTYEADLPYAQKRVLIDLDMGYDIPEHVLWYDIEVDSRAGFPRPENPFQRILSIACMSYSGKEYFFAYEDERRTIEEFLEVARRYEVLSGWNVAHFDWPYIKARAGRLGLRINDFLYPHIDLYLIYKEVFKRKQESYALSAVTKKILGREIEDWGIEGKVWMMYELWQKELGKLKAYTMKQVEATKDIDLELQLIRLRAQICKMAHISPYTEAIQRGKTWEVKMLKNNSIIDGLVLAEAQKHEPRIVFPTKKRLFDEEDSDRYTGGFVMNPSPGLHDYVGVLDFAATYPAIIQTFNVGLDTWIPEKRDDCIFAYHGSFRKDRESMPSRVVGLLVELRMKYKKERNKYHPASKEYKILDAMQFGVKFTANSFYGVLGFPSSRYYRKEIAENITQYCRALFMYSTNWFRRRGYRILYGDTDGFFVQPIKKPESPQKFLEQLQEDLEQFRPDLKEFILNVYNVPEERYKIDLKIDRVFEKLYMTTKKKRYCGRIIWEDDKWVEPYIHVKGFETVRGDWIELAKKVQADVFELLLSGASYKQIKKHLENIHKRMLKGEFDDMLWQMKGLSQEIEDYKSKQVHVRAAEMMLKRGMHVRVGDKVKFIYDGDRIYLSTDELTTAARDKIWRHHVLPVIERLELDRLYTVSLDKWLKR